MGNILSKNVFMNDTYNNYLFALIDKRFKVFPNPPKNGLWGST